MTDHEKRRPGRPKGDAINDDDMLNRMANLILENPNLKPTTALKRLDVWEDKDIRRIRGRWKERGQILLANAKKRKEAKGARRLSCGYVSNSYANRDALGAFELIQKNIAMIGMPDRAIACRRPQEQVEKLLEANRFVEQYERWDKMQRDITRRMQGF